MDDNKMDINEEELRSRLTPEEYKVLREGGTEAPFSGEYIDHNVDGMYRCKVCDNPLFMSDTQEDATHSPMGLQGWPSFNNAIPGSIETRLDTSHGMRRTEIVCAKCGSHLGHLFDDSSTKTGQHYCINSVCLNLEEK